MPLTSSPNKFSNRMLGVQRHSKDGNRDPHLFRKCSRQILLLSGGRQEDYGQGQGDSPRSRPFLVVTLNNTLKYSCGHFSLRH